MSRIGRMIIAPPGGVSVEQASGEVRVKGPKGSLAQTIPSGITVELASGEVRVTRADDRKPTRSLHGLSRALLANMVKGVTDGFVRNLKIEGVGYRAETDGKVLKLALWLSHPVALQIPAGLTVTVEANTSVKIAGIDKALVGQFAANVRAIRPPEPYKGKGVRYADEHIRRKVGKAGAA